MLCAMVFAEVVDRNQSVVCDALAGRVRWTSAETWTRTWGQPRVPVLSIRATMIPGYSFPAAQQAQISELLLVHSRGF